MKLPRVDPMDILWIIVLLGYAICVAQALFALATKKPLLARTSLGVLVAALGAHTFWLFARGIKTGRCPLVGTQEMCAFLSWGLVVSYLIAYRWYRANALKAFIFPIVLVLVAVAAISPATSRGPEGLDNPLQRILLPVHAGLILLAYAAFFIAFGAGLMYIIQERELKHKKFGRIFYKLPSLDTCDDISVKSLAIGFLMLTLGIAAGIYWHGLLDGRFWSGTGIEIFSVATWVIYFFLIQSRMNAGWGGRTSALASIVSFLIVVCSLVGLRYLGTLHTFG
jgi:ABC-type transport system involved in cytochrome c biogenesis permease subunit